MARWEPGARGAAARPRPRAVRHPGFEQTTAAEIAQAVGLTERTFFRHFADKREVLFQGRSSSSTAFLRGSGRSAAASASPLEVVAAALRSAGAFFPDERRGLLPHPAVGDRREPGAAGARAAQARRARRRRSPRRCAPAASANRRPRWRRESGVTVFGIAFAQWIREGEQRSLPTIAADVLRELGALVDGAGLTRPDPSRTTL